MEVMHITKIGTNRGKRRIWLEFDYLALSEFVPGQNIEIVSSQESINIKVVDHETRLKVSKRGDKPLIEIREADIGFDDVVSKVRIVFRKKEIVLKPHTMYQRFSNRVRRLYNKLRRNDKLDFASLCTGGAIFDHAAHHALLRRGYESRVSFAVERTEKYIQSALRNCQELFDDQSVIINSELEYLNLDKSGKETEFSIVGIPCTGAGRSGRTKNQLSCAEEHDEAGHLFHYILNWLRKANSAVIFLECVPEYLRTASMMVVRKVLDLENYDVVEMELAGNDFGAIENRNRMVAVAIDKSIAPFFSEALVSRSVVTSTVNDLLEEVPADSDKWKDCHYLIAKEERDIAAGKGHRRVVVTGEEKSVKTIGKGYAKIRSDEPMLLKDADDPKGPSRLFTQVEHAKLKNIPPHLVEGNSMTTAQEILGQSGIYSMVQSVFTGIIEAIERWFKSSEGQCLAA